MRVITSQGKHNFNLGASSSRQRNFEVYLSHACEPSYGYCYALTGGTHYFRMPEICEGQLRIPLDHMYIVLHHLDGFLMYLSRLLKGEGKRLDLIAMKKPEYICDWLYAMTMFCHHIGHKDYVQIYHKKLNRTVVFYKAPKT